MKTQTTLTFLSTLLLFACAQESDVAKADPSFSNAAENRDMETASEIASPICGIVTKAGTNIDAREINTLKSFSDTVGQSSRWILAGYSDADGDTDLSLAIRKVSFNFSLNESSTNLTVTGLDLAFGENMTLIYQMKLGAISANSLTHDGVIQSFVAAYGDEDIQETTEAFLNLGPRVMFTYESNPCGAPTLKVKALDSYNGDVVVRFVENQIK